MAMLAPFVPYDPAETAQSYAGRLSMLHTGQRAARLLEDCGVKPARFSAGHFEEVARFAEAVGEDPAALQAGTIRTLSRYNRFRQEDFSRTVLSPRVRQFCPHCLREDGPGAEWRHRLEWCFWSFPMCARHRSALVEVPREGVGDIRGAVERAGGLDVAEMMTAGAEGGRCLVWLGDRLRSAQDSSWLNDQSIEQVLNASEMLGMVLDHGQDVRPARLSRMERGDALETGFLIYEQGGEAVYAALDDIRSKASATAIQAGPLAMYGVLYDWVDRRSQLIPPGPVREVLREHILDHDAYMVGERLLGEVVTERRLHSVKSLALTLKVDRRRMSRLLQKLGLVPEGATDGESGRLVFQVHDVEQLISDYETGTPLADVPEYIGATHRQTLAFYRAGLLPAVIPADAPGAVRGVIVARRVLDELLARIGALPSLDHDQRYQALTVGKACQRYGRPADVLIRDVLAGKIAAYRTFGEPRLHAVRVLMSDMVASQHAKVIQT
ncbi:TniQ family protein [Paracoccus sp. Z118]|uniref:TniQ family protein n=1 Tax=Paracoccus sp. Z118 TaxID=2851017 RepID=UPI001C2BC916|nr:TniQ family protein [Paracoccus sp. Z118]MBV0893025.1 TniQ family protein [Paracoccus sp. Z118]